MSPDAPSWCAGRGGGAGREATEKAYRGARTGRSRDGWGDVRRESLAGKPSLHVQAHGRGELVLAEKKTLRGGHHYPSGTRTGAERCGRGLNVEMNRTTFVKPVILGLPLTVRLGLGACAQAPRSAGDEKLPVAASTAHLADFATHVGGQHVRVMALVPTGAGPHTHELTPSRVEQVSRARLLALNGVAFEYQAEKLVQSASNPKLIVVDTSKGINILQGKDDQPGGNPHIWLDPENAVVQVENIRDALVQADPAHADDYKANVSRYLGRLLSLDREIAGKFAAWSKSAVHRLPSRVGLLRPPLWAGAGGGH